MLEIEFFHDVICSFCFPMAKRMHDILSEYENIRLTHRSFALAWEVSDLERMFGSHAAAKAEVLHHWEAANQNDDEHRFNIAGMAAQDFPFPHSQPALIAAKAAGMLGGEDSYWLLFDLLQAALFMSNLDIADEATIFQIVRESGLDFEEWLQWFRDPQVKQAVLADLKLAQQYGLGGVPALVVNQKYMFSGAQSQQRIEDFLKKVAQEEGLQLQKKVLSEAPFTFLDFNQGMACRLEEGQWKCD